MAINLSPLAGAGWQFFDDNGNVLSGGKLYTYEAGTTTPAATYTDASGVDLNTNPIILDAAGRVPFEIWLVQAVQYKFVLFTSTNVLLWTKDNIAAGADFALLANTTNVNEGDALVGFRQSNSSGILSGAVGSTVHNKLQEWVSVKDFGAVGNGITDDTVAIQNALNIASHVIVPVGQYLISSTINVPARKKLEFQGGTYVLGGIGTPAMFVKKSTMTSAAITINAGAIVDGGGVLGQLGNTGDGVQLISNGAILSNFYVSGVGGVGVRVGRSDTIYSNCNSTKLININSRDNGSHGIYCHDNSAQSAAAPAADANAGSLINCTAVANGGDGIRIGRAWWVTIVNALTETNAGWGLNISGTITPPDTVAEARYTNVFGGDFNESNAAGSLNIAGYGASVYFSAINQLESLTGVFSGLLSGRGSSLQNLTVRDGNATFDAGFSAGVLYPVRLRARGTGTNGDGAGIQYTNYQTGTSRTSGEIRCTQVDTNKDELTFWVNISGTLTQYLRVDPSALAVRPGTNGTIANGFSNSRWSVVYAVSGSINTSDARQKQQVRDLNDAERAVAMRLKSLIRVFKFNDAVAEKGENARIHVGILAQEVKEAFEAEGLDGFKYGLLCYDQWDDQFEDEHEEKKIVGEDGVETITYISTGKKKLAQAAGNAYGVRYSEMLAFIIGAL